MEVVDTEKSIYSDLQLYLRDSETMDLIPLAWESVRDLGSRQIIILKAPSEKISDEASHELLYVLPRDMGNVETNKVVVEFR